MGDGTVLQMASTGTIEKRLRELTAICIALTAERDLHRLLDLILTKARELTLADAGSLYLIEEDEATGESSLRFMLAQNDTVPLPDMESIVLPLDESSIAGYVAKTGRSVRLSDAYYVSDQYSFRFNPRLDMALGYRTYSVLAVPMRTPAGDVIGVLQLINRKTAPGPIPDVLRVEAHVVSFSYEDEEIVRALASQAAAAIENNRLLESIRRLFESFIRAAVLAVEQRDPATKGHSVRVAELSVSLAQSLAGATSGRWAGVAFTEDQLREIRYAAILHDFGKIGVREPVLVKAEKLYAHELDIIRHRFALAQYAVQYEALRRKLEYVLTQGLGDHGAAFAELDRWAAEQTERLAAYLRVIEAVNRPSVVDQDPNVGLLEEIARVRFPTPAGTEQALLTPREVSRLSIPRGSLDDEERREIESHAAKSYEFLRQIAWTKELRRVPEFAYAHHEKLDGSGYPRGLQGDAIPLQVRIITIADIYDALVASDRPYKPAVPPEEALAILEESARDGQLDADLVQVFREAGVWRRTLGWRKP
jgi:HD-GYP domain-containing protein (c-di-GMP phosphodiesterase class II)